MSDFGSRSRDSSASSTEHEQVQRSPGKQTLSEARYPVQRTGASAGPSGSAAGEAPAAYAPRSASDAGTLDDPFDFTFASVQAGARGVQRRAVQLRGAGAQEDPTAVHAAAERGVAGAATSLPFLDTIQTSFGRHDVGEVRAHVGGEARDAAHAMGAQAFATGDHVAFAEAPSLHTAAHEAAHVVQQRAGVHLKGGVGAEGDVYESHADEVADAVVAGRPAEALLDRLAPGANDTGSPAAAAVSRKAASATVVQRALLAKMNAEPAYRDGLSFNTIVASALDKEPAPKKVGADWTGAANKAARKAFKDVCGETDQTKFDGLVSDARFLQPGEVHGNTVYNNKSGDLPSTTAYKEYDIEKYKGDPKARGSDRIVVGADGKRYYTANHYTDFAEF